MLEYYWPKIIVIYYKRYRSYEFFEPAGSYFHILEMADAAKALTQKLPNKNTKKGESVAARSWNHYTHLLNFKYILNKC